MNRSRLALALVALPFGLLAAAQLVPYGHAHSNPPVVREPAWNTPETRALAERACFDCHSNQTKWPWYASIAPVSWLVQDHVDEGRAILNFSEWDKPYEEASEAAETLQEGEMPVAGYTWLHPEADLSPAEKATLIAGLTATLGGAAGAKGAEGPGDDEGDER